MRTFLGVLMVVIVSGDVEISKDVLDDSVLLPCNCSGRNLDKDFKWQKENASTTMQVFKHNRKSSMFADKYEGRAKVFLSESSNNCSVLLTNITADDQGKYRCIFYIEEMYQKLFVYLNISARYDVCQTADHLDGGGKVFQCDAKGRYRKAEIQWNLHGRILTNSTTTYITHTHTLDASTGLYNFNSTLSTKLNWMSEPTCHVKAKGISTINSDCPATTELKGHPHFHIRYRYLTIIPIMLVLGLCLLLWWRRDRSTSHPRIREVETVNFLC